MSENAWSDGPGGEPPAKRDPFSLRAAVEREFAAVAAAGGSNLAAVLDDLDRVRSADGPSREDIVAALDAVRAERDERADSWKH